MAAAIESKTGTKSELIPGDAGIFDVEVDGRMIFSKHEANRFPEEDEILSQLD